MDIAVFDGKTATEHAEDAAQAIRAINHLTFHASALAYPSDAWRLIGQLNVLAARLPQAFRQIAHLLQRWQDAGQVGIDPGTRYAGNPALAIATAEIHLTEDATVAAGQLAEALDVVWEALTYAHHIDPDTDDRDDEVDEVDEVDATGASS
jgi:hypothetical protein